MSPIGRAPFLPVFAGWCAALSLSFRGHPASIALMGTLVTAGIILLGTDRFPPGSMQYLPVTLLVVALPAGFLAWKVQNPPNMDRFFEGDAVVEAERPWGYRRALVLRTDREGRILCLLSPASPCNEGTGVRLSGRVVPLQRLFPTQRGDFDAVRYWRAKGVHAGFIPREFCLVGNYRCRLSLWRTVLRRRLLFCLPPLLRGHLLAAWTGSRDPETAQLHRRWGTAHLLAVSGFHVGILAGLLLWCLRGIRFKLLWSSSILWIYVFLAGGAASACRAMLMIQLALLGPAVAGRPSTPINSVSVAGGMLLLLNPWLFWDIGWRLSVISALVLCSFLQGHRSPQAVVGTSFAVWLATAGEASRVFGSIPAAGLVTNLLALPAFSILLPVASIAAIPSLAGLPGGGAIALGMEGIFEIWKTVANTLCFLIPWQVSYTPFMGCLSVAVLAYAAAYALGIGWKRAGLLSVVAVLFRLLFS